ncbi:hypothetical protein AMAG_01070 [Allomyces macrogynus ATCC 38327]|uniref:Uncharacterized protein n=1 Tax=Allomyces macrogynus (strain ATCC 38327) TaxID=578462 RepID=A0A0L0RXP4_ALLM3|nr:hypothetical protein AMAG_01070 [Allomyces macrogynus ATCC 38327]|eukprot:KNE55147.1 hypothetical protein AMAG_01070 [Allomyces macrogynus ATCC 38327]
MTNSPADHDHGPDSAAVVPDSDRVARLLAPSSAARRKRSLFSACGPSSTRPPSIAQDPHKYPRVGRPIRSSSIAYSALFDDDLHDVLDAAGANDRHPTDDGKTSSPTHGAPPAAPATPAAAFAPDTTNADCPKGDESAPVTKYDAESAYSTTDDSSTDVDVSTVSSHRSSLLDLLSASATGPSAAAAPTTPTPGCCPVQLPSTSLRLFRRVLNHHRLLLLRSSKMASTLAAPLMPPTQRSLPVPPPPRHVFEESDVLSSDDDADTECVGREWDLPPSPPMSPAAAVPRMRPRTVSFAPEVEVRYTFAPGEYDRNPIDPPAMTARDYYEYQVIAFEMHQAIKFELTMRQLGMWAPAAPTVPTIPVVASTLERRREVQDTFARGTKVLVAKPRGQSLQYSQVNRAQVAAAMASADAKTASETASTVLDISLQA